MTKITGEHDEYVSISLSGLLAILKKEYKIILLVTFLSSVIGFFYVIITPKEYTSVGKILPEVSYKATNGIAGINQLLKKYNGNVDLFNTEITSPELYSEILNTKDFYDYILAKEVNTSRNKKMSLRAYYNLKQGDEKLDLERNDKIIEYNAIQDIQKRITITTKKSNLIFVSVKMQDPMVAADIANFTITYLIGYITKYRTEKARQGLCFIENLQKDLLKDSSKNEALKDEIQNSLSASIIQMRIKIQEDTPTIQVLEKAQISIANSEPSLSNALTVFTFLGFVLGVTIAFFKKQNYKKILISN